MHPKMLYYYAVSMHIKKAIWVVSLARYPGWTLKKKDMEQEISMMEDQGMFQYDKSKKQ